MVNVLLCNVCFSTGSGSSSSYFRRITASRTSLKERQPCSHCALHLVSLTSVAKASLGVWWEVHGLVYNYFGNGLL